MNSNADVTNLCLNLMVLQEEILRKGVNIHETFGQGFF